MIQRFRLIKFSFTQSNWKILIKSSHPLHEIMYKETNVKWERKRKEQKGSYVRWLVWMEGCVYLTLIISETEQKRSLCSTNAKT